MQTYKFLQDRKMDWSQEDGTILLLALAYQSIRINPITEKQKSIALDLLKTMEEHVYDANL